MKNFAEWYFILGIITCIIGGYRSWRYNIEQDEMSGLAWFLAWWIYLPFFIYRATYLKIKNFKNGNK